MLLDLCIAISNLILTSFQQFTVVLIMKQVLHVAGAHEYSSTWGRRSRSYCSMLAVLTIVLLHVGGAHM